MPLIESESDLQELYDAVKDIIGEICWEVAPAYGETYLEIGEMATFVHHNRTIRSREWTIATQGTYWRLTRRGKLEVTSENVPDLIEEKTQAVTNATIKGIQIEFPSLSLTVDFDNDYVFSILPRDSDRYEEVAYWRIYTPNDHFIDVGPGEKWEYR